LLKEKNRGEIELLAEQIDSSLREEFEKLAEELEKGYEKEDALFLLLSFFKKMKRIVERMEEGRRKLLLPRIKKAFIKAAFDFGITKKELGGYLKELGIWEKKEERKEVRKAVTVEEVRKRIKPQKTRREEGIEIKEFVLLLILIFLLLYSLLRLL